MVRYISFLSLLFTMLWSQSNERGDPDYRRATNIDVNKIRATIFNFGITGRTWANPGEIPYEWPVNSGQHYIAMTALAVGAEIITNDGEVRPLVTIPYRSDQSGNSMAWEPVPGYLNPNSQKIAISDDESTWPSNWPDKMDDVNDPGWSGAWNGYFGRNQFNAQQEIYYKTSDDRNFIMGRAYTPDTTDINRKGAGLMTGVRVLEWKQILIEDVVFILHEIKNDASYDYDKVSFSMWLADLVGGDGDSGDDTPDFDLLYDVAWSMDSDGIGNSAFGTDPVGVAATSFIETPGNNIDRIDNDGDGEDNGPIIFENMIENEILGNAKDDNGNGLVDENMTHVPFGDQVGVTYADNIDNDQDGEMNSPVVTQEMINAASSQWEIWPPIDDDIQDSIIHIVGLDETDLGFYYADGIDNNSNPNDPYALEYPIGLGAEVNSPLVDSNMVLSASNDAWLRYSVPNSNIILYDVNTEDIGKPYADGIDNDGDGAIDEGIDEGIDEMIDESRDDFIDNDGDWEFSDDVGINGDESGGLGAGVGDQKPSSGSGTGFPGEPNIDKTDVSESDQMGLTAVGYDPAGSIPITSDNYLWLFYMTPGTYWQPPPGGQPPGDYDLFVTSGFFPLEAGQTERIAMSVVLGNDEADALRNKAVAQTTYDFDYQFAKAPSPPNVTAVSGDRKVTLYWDESAEQSLDKYMAEITNGTDLYDFEGYKIYRATDFEFNDAYTITDGEGNLTFLEPYLQNGAKAQWDLVNGKSGWHPVDLNGIKFYLGDDTGLQHSYVDENVVNGQRYFYAVVSYDYGGDLSNDIIPSDSPMRLRVNSLTGTLEMGPNVVEVIPSPPAAGYTDAEFSGDQINHISGTSSGEIYLDIVDPMAIKNYHTYQITFTDTILLNQQGPAGSDTVTTKSYYLVDVTFEDVPDTLVNNDHHLPKSDVQVTDGFQLTFNNVSELGFNAEESGWSRDSLWTFTVMRYATFNVVGTKLPYDYRIIFSDAQTDSCIDLCMRYLPNTTTCFPGYNYPGKEVNFIVQRRESLTGIDEIDWVTIPVGFIDVIPVGDTDGYFNADGNRESDWIVFMDYEDDEGNPSPSWAFYLNLHPNDEELIYDAPQPGDTAYVTIEKPFLENDIYEFTTIASYIDTDQAKKDMSKIKVVPNPYYAASVFEGQNTFSTGRGPREIQFRNLPEECTIRIFTISGELVKTIHHTSTIDSGTGKWDLLTNGNLTAAYGVYIYHIDAPGVGEKIGKMAIVK
ncbi:MAG TPA: hypothetical protein QGF17_01975 [Candidatus Marinimicrobia bacterium]|nr:hypothetical protein [Candidatus Neomarinimicrobiota bacterium]